jgi:hypothetical protein
LSRCARTGWILRCGHAEMKHWTATAVYLLLIAGCRTATTDSSRSGSVPAPVLSTFPAEFPESDAARLLDDPQPAALVEYVAAVNSEARRALLGRILCDATQQDQLVDAMAAFDAKALHVWLTLGTPSTAGGHTTAMFHVGTPAGASAPAAEASEWELDSTFGSSALGPRSRCIESVVVHPRDPLPDASVVALTTSAMTVGSKT